MKTNHRDKRLRSWLFAAVGATFCAVAAGPAIAAGLPASVKALVPAAQTQGSLLVWKTTLNPRQISAMSNAFNGYYGTSIELAHKGGRQDIKARQMAFASKKGVPTGVDVFWTPVPKSLIDANALVAVKLWGYWAVSPEGQKTLERVRGYSLVGTKTSKLYEYTKSRKVYRVPLDWRMKNQGRLVGKFVKIIKAARRQTLSAELPRGSS